MNTPTINGGLGRAPQDIKSQIKSHNEYSRTGDFITNELRNRQFARWQANPQTPPPQLIYALVRQSVDTIHDEHTQEQAVQNTDTHKAETEAVAQYIYVSDNNGFRYLLDKGSMKIIHSINNSPASKASKKGS